MIELPLPGCTPEPLMGYLKALGVFRLVAEQVDPTATLSWNGGTAHLTSKFDRDGLINFFLEDYRPTPIVGPWGARSGFYPGSSESSARDALNAIVAAADARPRLSPFREMIVGVRKLLDRYEFREKVRDEDKLILMQACRNDLPDELGGWLDTVFVLTEESRKFPPLLGTGGNEGSGSYVSTFAQVAQSLLVVRSCDGGVRTALFGEMASALESVAVGHFNPGAIGGPNSSQGFGGGGGVNPWDYLLAIEGSLMFAGKAARRLGTDTEKRAGYPFCVEAIAVGYASASDKEASEATRAEVWLPLWSAPVSLAELTYLFGEGRAQLGRRQATNAVEFALALAALGVSRGIDSFIRYAFVMRNGLSFFAAPLGRVAVTPRPMARLLDDPPLTSWLHQIRKACRETEKTPARYQTALRQIDRAMFEFANRSEQGEDADRRALREVLAALGRAERTLAGGLRFCADKYIRPLQGLSPRWLDQANDGSPEFRLAAALAGVGSSKKGEVGPFRAYLEEVAVTKFVTWSAGSTSAIWSNRPLAANLAAVFSRRQMEAYRGGIPGVPLRSSRPAPLRDVLAFLREETDDDRLGDLIWGLIAVEYPPEFQLPHPGEAEIPFEFGVPRLLVEPLCLFPSGGSWNLGEIGESTTPDPEVFDNLSSGRRDAVGECVDRAARRLKSGGRLVNGYRNRQRAGKSLAVVSSFPADRLLAAMLFPLSPLDLEKVANAVLYPPQPLE